MLPLALLTLALWALPTHAVVPSTAVPYSQINNATFKNQWAIKIALGSHNIVGGGFVNHVCQTNVSGTACNQPPIQQDTGALVKISWTAVNTSSSYVFKTLHGDAPQTVAVRMCYFPSSAVGRAWRKKNNGFPKYGMHCYYSTPEVPFNAAGGEVVFDFNVEDKVTSGVFYPEVCVKCTTASGDLDYCQCDRTGPAGAISSFNSIETQTELGITTGMRAAAIIFSVFGPLYLAVFYVADSIKFKKTGSGINLY